MKASIQNSFDIGGISFNLETAYYATKRDGSWIVTLNYHKLTVIKHEPAEDDIGLLVRGFSVQTSRSDDLISEVLSILGLIGIVAEIVSILSHVLTILADVEGLIDRVFTWANEALDKLLQGQDPFDRTMLDNTIFVLQLIKDGVVLSRKCPRWRQKLYNIEG